MDEHPPDDGPDDDGPRLPEASPSPYQRTEGVQRLEAIEAELAEVERAVARLEDGTYGRCAVCGDAIADAVLAERPTAEVCAAHLDVLSR